MREGEAAARAGVREGMRLVEIDGRSTRGMHARALRETLAARAGSEYSVTLATTGRSWDAARSGCFSMASAASAASASPLARVLSEAASSDAAGGSCEAASGAADAHSESSSCGVATPQTATPMASPMHGGPRMPPVLDDETASMPKKASEASPKGAAAGARLPDGVCGKAAKSGQKQLAKERPPDSGAAPTVGSGARVAKARGEKRRLAAERALPASEKKERNEAASMLQKQVKAKQASRAERPQQRDKSKGPKSAAERSQAARAQADTRGKRTRPSAPLTTPTLPSIHVAASSVLPTSPTRVKPHTQV